MTSRRSIVVFPDAQPSILYRATSFYSLCVSSSIAFGNNTWFSSWR